MTQSLTGSWMKEITAGYAPPASEETGIRYPCPRRVLNRLPARQDGYYNRNRMWKNKGSDTAANRRTLVRSEV